MKWKRRRATEKLLYRNVRTPNSLTPERRVAIQRNRGRRRQTSRVGRAAEARQRQETRVYPRASCSALLTRVRILRWTHSETVRSQGRHLQKVHYLDFSRSDPTEHLGDMVGTLTLTRVSSLVCAPADTFFFASYFLCS